MLDECCICSHLTKNNVKRMFHKFFAFYKDNVIEFLYWLLLLVKLGYATTLLRPNNWLLSLTNATTLLTNNEQQKVNQLQRRQLLIAKYWSSIYFFTHHSCPVCITFSASIVQFLSNQQTGLPSWHNCFRIPLGESVLS